MKHTQYTKFILSGSVFVVILLAGAGCSFQKAPTPPEGSMMKQEEKIMAPENTTGTNDAMMQKNENEAMEKKTDSVMDDKKEAAVIQKGSYQAYDASKLSLANSGDVVLFFHAPWCPTCRTANSDIEANLESIPAGVTILKTDYDSSTDLKKKYGVTYQHTFVQVAANGTMIKKWSGGNSLASILSQVQ